MSASTRVSLARCSNRRRSSRPVNTTEPASKLRTRVIGMNTRRRGCTSTTKPCTRGGRGPGSVTTASRIRPIWSPFGSNTGVPASRAMKILTSAA
jgi:hypothetical protein